MTEKQLNCVGNDRFALMGVIHFNNVTDLYHAGCQHITDCTAATMHIELKQLDHSSSACLALLVAWMRHASGCGKAVEYHDAPSYLLSMAQVTGVAKVLFAPQ